MPHVVAPSIHALGIIEISGCGRKINKRIKKWGRIAGRSDLGVGKDLFIENNITRNIDATRGNMQALVSFMLATVHEEDTSLGLELQLSIIVRTKTWPTRAPKSFQEGIIRRHIE